ncbi:MAG: Extracellular solute-binding protein family 1 [Candidatus Gottesmanbacteria bacterium GW2011_GWC2_39_8]|uniref:Extracellular solute-binding protein family 1 n=1 Tax=Candidatus Gottesmanbacteria bacterium GW2011_GWC2_39_8 TaxID=1618450 RepID=A0A0G0S6H7_9BACT|nr:MAG: Extracellular solute-binding protein family 1 [Candidatus Gottesmanbacteria bacterium GW2011_GWC2_39_8]
MNKLSFFQIILTILLGVIAVVAVLVFSGILPGYKKQGGSRGPTIQVSLWGPLPEGQINRVLSGVNKENKPYNINYTEIPPSSYEETVVDALASGKGPDFWIISQDMILKNKERISVIPFLVYPERNFRDNFVDISSLLIEPKGEGLTGIPFLADPLIMYWNKDLFSSAGASQPPKDWNDFAEAVAIFTQKNEAGNVVQSGTALGELSNIKNGKDLLSMLIIQSGNPIMKTDNAGNFKISLGEDDNAGNNPAVSSVKFFNSFSDPNKDTYSWNKALPEAGDMFAKGALAMYFGYASELPDIIERNPHLNFDIAEVPQIKGDKTKTGFAKMYSFAIMKNVSQAKKQAVINSILFITSSNVAKAFSQETGLASLRRDLLSERTTDAYFGLVNKAVVMAKSWLEPDGAEVRRIFKDMIESTASGSLSADASVRLANTRLDQELRKVARQ